MATLPTPFNPQNRGKAEREFERKRVFDKSRAHVEHRGWYNGKWRPYRLAFLRRNPLCIACERNGRLTDAQVVDHIKPHKGDSKLFWDKTNHQALCKPCHDRKTATEDSRFAP